MSGSGGVSRLYVPSGYRATGAGAISPHLAGSAFQLIGNSASAIANIASGRASVPGQSMASPDVVMLTRMLQEKENSFPTASSRYDPGTRSPTGMSSELTQLRRAHHELTVKFSQLQLDLEDRDRQLRAIDRYHPSLAFPTASSRYDPGTRSPTGMSSELTQLRRAHHELTVKFSQLQLDLEDRDRQLRAIDRYHPSLAVGVMYPINPKL
ncbi:hypothetical protein AHF37_08087 [Paragonimus kellicotti]|nr:hypothetical protein AHF37_08087 [Paragonimus kellicotti]